MGNGFLAAAASLWLPGLGHELAHCRRRGVLWFVACILVTATVILSITIPSLVPALVVLLPLALLFTLAHFIDAWRAGRKAAHPRFRSAGARVLAGAGFVVAAAVAPAALPVGLLVRATLVETFEMPSGSMGPTLLPGDRFAVHKRGGWNRWDVVAFHFPEDPEMKFVMRIAGLPGERVEIINDAVTIDGQPIEPPAGIGTYPMDEGIERWIGRRGNGCEGNPITLADDEYFVLGDDSPMARDSRAWQDAPPGHQPGAVPANMIIGRATWTYWPPSRWKNLEPSR